MFLTPGEGKTIIKKIKKKKEGSCCGTLPKEDIYAEASF